MSVAFYFDQNMQFAVVVALRERGCDVLTALDDAHDRRPDDEILDRAQALSRVVVTHDQDFLELAAERQSSCKEFPGIVFCQLSKSSIGGMVKDLVLIAEATSYDELRNQVVWVPL